METDFVPIFTPQSSSSYFCCFIFTRNVPLVAIPLFRNHIAQKVSSNGLLHIISIADPDGHWSKCFMWCPLCYCRPGKFTMIPWILYLSVQVSSV